jgi:hypothetical protein
MMAPFDKSIFYFAIAMFVFGVLATSQWERTLYFIMGGLSLVIAICWDWIMSLINKDREP